MKHTSLGLCILALASFTATAAHADTFFNFSFTGNNTAYGIPGSPFSGSGQFDTKTTSTPGEYKVVGVTGTTDGMSIVKLVTVGGYQGNDNLLFYTNGAASATLDESGISYQLSNGFDANLFLNTSDHPAQDQELIFLSGENAPISITALPTPSSVPEPGTFFLLGSGALGMIGTIRRKLTV